MVESDDAIVAVCVFWRTPSNLPISHPPPSVPLNIHNEPHLYLHSCIQHAHTHTHGQTCACTQKHTRTRAHDAETHSHMYARAPACTQKDPRGPPTHLQACICVQARWGAVSTHTCVSRCVCCQLHHLGTKACHCWLFVSVSLVIRQGWCDVTSAWRRQLPSGCLAHGP